MDLIVIGDYTPPSPNKYDVEFVDVNGAEEQFENGYNYIEQVRPQAPKISLAWTNIIEADAVKIINSVRPAQINCSYFFGTTRSDTFTCKNQQLTLKLDNGVRYYDLSLTLEG